MALGCLGEGIDLIACMRVCCLREKGERGKMEKGEEGGEIDLFVYNFTLSK